MVGHIGVPPLLAKRDRTPLGIPGGVGGSPPYPEMDPTEEFILLWRWGFPPAGCWLVCIGADGYLWVVWWVGWLFVSSRLGLA